MNKRERDTLHNRLARLAKNECANYDCGKCPLFQSGCIVEINKTAQLDTMRGSVCGYFMQSVLPAEPQLMEDYLEHFPKDYPLRKQQAESNKRCRRCEVKFTPKSNAQKYCSDCRPIVERENDKQRKRKSALDNAIK